MARLAIRDAGEAVSLNGSTNGVTIDGYNIPDSFSLSFWLSPRTITDSVRIVDCAASGPANGFEIRFVISGGIPYLRFIVYNGASTQTALDIPNIKRGEYIHVGASFTTNSAKIFKNSVEIASDVSAIKSATTATLTLGKRAVSAGNFYNGLLHDFRMFNKVLTQDEWDNLYFYNIQPTGCDVHYQFLENLTDISGNGHDGVAVGSLSYNALTVPFSERTQI
jgi:hypothetical protein